MKSRAIIPFLLLASLLLGSCAPAATPSVQDAVDISSTPEVTTGTQTSLSPLRFDCQNIQEIPTEECQALLALYESTDGDHWQDNSGWLVDQTPCTWYGVMCQGGHVLELQLFYNNLSGSLPPEIGNLTDLQSLYLDGNVLGGALPAELGKLTSLQTARLGDNQFSGIPAEIGNLQNLVFLELWGNQLSEEIPAGLGGLSRLQQLNLSSNQFTGGIPPELGNLANLTHLYLSHNQLSGSIPATLGDLTNLNELNLSFNRLNGSIPTELENLTALYWLDLSYNQLTGVVPAGLAKAPISDRRLWGNLLDGTVPASEAGSVPVDYRGVQFEFNSALAESVWPETGMAQPPVAERPAWEVRPEHIQFTFASPAKPDSFQVGGIGISGHPQILIYPTQTFSEMSELAGGQIESLQALLEARPPEPENQLPLLPLINASQVFHTQVKYLDFQNGRGVRFVTQYSQEVVGRLTNENIFYTFQGLTQDGAYHVAAFFPIAAEGLSDELVLEDWEAAQAHLAEDIQYLDSLSPNEFEPDLAVLDGLIESLLVDAP